jgi:outer membrane protein TolC
MKTAKQIAALALAVVFASGAAIPASAEEAAQTAYRVEYSQVEQLVLQNNLQVNSNDRLIKSMDDEKELKEKYAQLSDTLSQASAGMNAIIANPMAGSDLKAVAQGTNAALSSLNAILNMQQDVSEDDFELVELQAQLSDYQLVKAAQSMFSVYYQLQYNIEKLTNTRVVLENQVKTAQARLDVKQATPVAVADAKAAVAELDYNLNALKSQSKSVAYQMNQLLGHAYNDQITFGAMPAPDTAYAAKISLAADIPAAQDASYKIKISQKQRAIIDDDTSENRDKRQIKSNDAEMERQNIGASLEKQNDTILKQQDILKTELQKLDNAKLKQDQAQKKYDLGLMSGIEYTKIKNDYLAQKSVTDGASAALFWEIENYRWMVKGLPAS